MREAKHGEHKKVIYHVKSSVFAERRSKRKGFLQPKWDLKLFPFVLAV
jgi:hypothetical protein